MIKRFHVSNYKALVDVTLELRPVSLLIGPNDSGKTSILEAINALCRSVDYPLSEAFEGAWDGRQLVNAADPLSHIELSAFFTCGTQQVKYHIECEFPTAGRTVVVRTEDVLLGSGSNTNPVELQMGRGAATAVQQIVANGPPDIPDVGVRAKKKQTATCIHEGLSGVQFCAWDPRMLALPAALDPKRPFRLERNGFGLARCLDDILGHDRQLFDQLENKYREIFPAVQSVRLKQALGYKLDADHTGYGARLQPHAGKGVYFEMDGAGELSAQHVSDGMLIVLAFLALVHTPAPPRVFLVGEPENGIHPQRLGEVIDVLRRAVGKSDETQVVMTTHSPYILDFFEADDVMLCRKRADGTVALKRMSEISLVDDQRDVFTLGEIWTGEGDEALMEAAAATEGS